MLHGCRLCGGLRAVRTLLQLPTASALPLVTPRLNSWSGGVGSYGAPHLFRSHNAMSIQAKLDKKPPYKLLACDGGGIRGIISIEILAKIEDELRVSSGNAKLVLA